MAVSSGFETLAIHLIIKVTQTSYIIGSSAVLLQMDSISLITNIYFLISKRGNAAFFRTCMQQVTFPVGSYTKIVFVLNL
jgi:hypothetical protein